MHSLKRVRGFFGYGTIGNPLRFALAISAEILFLSLQIRQGCGPAGFAFSQMGSLRMMASAAAGFAAVAQQEQQNSYRQQMPLPVTTLW